ncbi:GNAT family N-acetyltransferase [Cohnella mopanensis]|uniref:GNAT family N-acetyltransferase n=1 Tax=Cohnella mopanensis TaxID=2911966 RepID=UPI001EF8266A|nr:GNAT family N-acetyltransferase [Cohnella mopanensis]
MDYLIRKANINDIKRLSELFTEFIGVESNPIAMKDQLNLISSNPNYFVAVACDGDQVIGTAMAVQCYDLVGNCNPFLLVENVVVSSAYRGKGTGKLLMKAIEDFGEERECSYIILVSGNQRIQSHDFYKALGYSSENVGFKKRLKQIS